MQIGQIFSHVNKLNDLQIVSTLLSLQSEGKLPPCGLAARLQLQVQEEDLTSE